MKIKKTIKLNTINNYLMIFDVLTYNRLYVSNIILGPKYVI